jgi:ferredoxin
LDVVDVVISEDFFLAQMEDLVSGELKEIEESAKASGDVLALSEANVPNSLIAEMTGLSVGAEGESISEMDPDVSRVLTNADEELASTEMEDVDYDNVESHQLVEKDSDGNPLRSQAVYVDEVTCIGCTMCASVAQSTFFMEEEHGRARVFKQWGDDDETVGIAIETCPVDCIHYVPYEELERLEIERRGQNINFKARLVSQGEGGQVDGMRVGGAVKFTGQQKISGNSGSRCNNCPSRGCKDCPMYGVGESPEFKRREEERRVRDMERRMKKEKVKEQKRADL